MLTFANKEPNLQTTTTLGKSHGEADVLHHACPKAQSSQKVRKKSLALCFSSITEYSLGLPLHRLQRIPHPSQISCMDGRLAEEQEKRGQARRHRRCEYPSESGSAQIR